MRVEFSYNKNKKVKHYKYTVPERMQNGDRQYCIRLAVRMMMNYIYDQGIEKSNWINGYIYDGETCLGEINYFGNFI